MRILTVLAVLINLLVTTPVSGQAVRQTVIITASAPVFSAPDDTQPPLRIAREGSVLLLVNSADGWHHIEFEDPQFGRRIGYVQQRYARLGTPPPSQSQPTDLSVRTAAPRAIASPASRPVTAAAPTIFGDIDYFEAQGEEERRRDARLELDSSTAMLRVVERKNGPNRATYLEVPYGSITKVVYERSAHRRYKAGILISPWLLLTKGKKHWLTVEFSDVPTHPIGYASAQLDKDNYRRVLTAISAATGLKVEEIIEN
ncbi:MAG: hypothetical protein HOP16_18970 [Acidobacteria bacterium]|nr:hypothetical protein [Acidobacteriota bacterium]